MMKTFKLPRHFRRALTRKGDLIEFYKSIGWNEGEVLDPSKIEMNPDYVANVINKFCYNKVPEEYNKYLALWLQYGPRSNTKVPAKCVRLHDEKMCRYMQDNYPGYLKSTEQ